MNAELLFFFRIHNSTFIISSWVSIQLCFPASGKRTWITRLDSAGWNVSIQLCFPASGKDKGNDVLYGDSSTFPFNFVSQRVGRVRLRGLTVSRLQTTNRRTPKSYGCNMTEIVIATYLKRLQDKASTQVNEKIGFSAICRGASI